MMFSKQINRLPRAFDADLGAEARAAVPEVDGDLARLLAGAGGSSPYLKTLIERERAWLVGALDSPEAALQSTMAALRETPPDQLAVKLRQAKRQVALITGLADLAGVWALEKVTGTLTDFADLASQLAMQAAIGAEIARKKLPGATEDDIPTAGGMVSIAMGKMGAHELNYSSDIDLICLFDESRYEPDDYQDARASFIRATRKMSAMLNDITGEGYVFRTDLRLRPDPAVTPVCMAMEAAERYYESLGRTWERAAYIKARPSAGDLVAGQRFLDTLRPFVWRKHLDFAAIQDAHDMRLRIRKHKGLGGPISLDGHDMKLGRGGIREIEFFTQTRQLIAGGRDPYLRDRHTVPALKKLAHRGWVPEDAAETLTQQYRFHREVEHRIQMVADAQTHRLPKGADGWGRIAGLMGRDIEELRADIGARLTEVHALTEGFFAPDVGGAPQDQGAHDPEIVERWKTYPALRSARAVEVFDRLKPELLSRLAQSARPADSLLALDGFLKGLPAGVQLFSLLEANTQLIDLLVDIVGTAPALAQHLSRNSGVLDAVIGGTFFAEWPGVQALTAELVERLMREGDYEHQLDMARRWAKEWQFRVGVHHLRGLIGAEEAGQQYADLADAVVSGLWQPVCDDFSKKHGPMPGRGAMVLGMGSLGAQRLNASSDLDLIVIYDAAGVEQSDGRRPLAARSYYARLTQTLVTAMSAPMAHGRLYEVDMRLRPSGNQGPVATSLAAFETYQKNDAWTWEHLALTRARSVVGTPEMMEQVEALRQDIVGMTRDAVTVRADVRDMRKRIAAAKPSDQVWDAKLGAGRLQDIELLSQAGALLAGSTRRSVEAGTQAGVAIDWLDAGDAVALTSTYRLCWQVQLASKLLTGDVLDPDQIGAGGRVFLLRETGHDSIEGLHRDLQTRCSAAAAIIETALAEARDVGEDEDG